jgi:deazaflavin-dependent oxidoreductase (nitroreductase family)
MKLLDRVVQKMSGARWFSKVGPRVAPQFDSFVHRITRGRVIPTAGYRGALMLTVIGRKSGLERTVPLLTMPDGDRWVVIASNFGREQHPAWSENLLANPEATVQLPGRRTVRVRGRLIEGEERDDLWQKIVDYHPNYDLYAERADREIRVFVLEPTERT